MLVENDIENMNDVETIEQQPNENESNDQIDEQSTKVLDLIDDKAPKLRVVAGLGRLRSANLMLANDILNKVDDKIRDEIINEIHDLSLSSMRPSSKIRIFKSKANLKMSHLNINQVLPVEYPQPFEIIWSNINYKIRTIVRTKGLINTPKFDWKDILNNTSGYVRSGEITAIMGPSGAGKSTLLEIIAGRRRFGRLTGHVGVRHTTKICLAYVPQDNYLMGTLTVKETLKFACRIQNITMKDSDVEQKVKKVIEMFGLNLICNTPVERCSGGQQKRVSIANELFSNPNVLILDEPTTGLDSPSCAAVTKILRDLVDTPQHQIAVIATIHQPPWNVFTEFHQVYILSRSGSPLYLGTPTDLLTRLEEVGYPCARYNSPADHVIEIAAGDHSEDAVEKMVFEHQKCMIRPQSPISTNANNFKLETIIVKRKVSFWTSFPILFNRSWIIYRRHLGLNCIRIISIFLISIWLCLIFGTEVGKVSGCVFRKLELYSIPVEKLSSVFEDSILMVSQNACALFFGLMVGLISGMVSTVLEFPREMKIFNKEYKNGWYSAFGFYLSKTIIDIPMQIIVPSIYVVIMYYYTNQPRQFWRAGYLWYITMAVTFCAESLGAMSAAIFMERPMAAAFFATAIPLPMCMFGGLLVKYSRMPWYMQAASWTSLLKYAFEGIILVMYGFDRCDFSYQEFLENTNISAIEKPLWAKYMPAVLSILNPEEFDGNEFIDQTPDPNIDQDEEFIKRIYSLGISVSNDEDPETRAKIKNSTIIDFNRSLILAYFELNEDYILYVNIIVMTCYYIGLKLLTYIIILLKLKSI